MSITAPGVAIGTIVNVQDPEQRGRVQLQLPVQLGSTPSGWAPIANGKIAADGSRIDPQPGDSAIVGFVNGEVDIPVVVGWYSPHGASLAVPEKPAIPTATDLALRAIVAGLFSSHAISTNQVRGVMAALKEAAGAAQGRREPEAAKALLKLMRGVHVDTAVV
jgi:uncharacterized protein involved in type VI secretion and phage assembly